MLSFWKFVVLFEAALLGCPYVLAGYNVTALFEAFKHSERYYKFTNVPIFIGHNVSREERDQLHGLIHAERKYLQYIYTRHGETSMFNILRIHIKHDTMSLVLTNGSADPIWLVVDRRLRKLRQTDMIILMDDAVEAAAAEEEKLYHKLWQMQFKHVILLHCGKIRTYTPYPKVRSYTVPEETREDFFPPRKIDLMGYVIDVPIDNDIPRIFCITDYAGNLHIKGFGYQLMSLFLGRLNGTMRVTNPHKKRSITSSVNMSLIINEIASKRLEISPHPYTGIKEGLGVMSYPLFKAGNCLITPVRNEIPRFMYLFRPLDVGTWWLLAVAIPYVAFILVLFSPRLARDGRQSFGQRYSRALLDSIAQILFLASVLRIYRPNRRYLFVYTQLAVLGFIITSWYSNLLASFFTTFLVGDQLYSFEDLIATQSRFMVKYYEMGMLDDMMPLHVQEKVLRLAVLVNASVMMEHLLSFNTSYSYPFTEERWWFFKLQQQYANKPIFRYSNICFGEPNIGFPMRTDSHLEHAMTQFVMDAQMAGLDFYLLRSEFKHALQAGYMKLLSNELPFKALSLDSLRMAWCLVGVGWLVAIFVFMVERLWGGRRKGDVAKLNV